MRKEKTMILNLNKHKAWIISNLKKGISIRGIYALLCQEKDFKGSYSTVQKYIKNNLSSDFYSMEKNFDNSNDSKQQDATIVLENNTVMNQYEENRDSTLQVLLKSQQKEIRELKAIVFEQNDTLKNITKALEAIKSSVQQVDESARLLMLAAMSSEVNNALKKLRADTKRVVAKKCKRV